ncbi:hypothetical protein T492DRAFT_893899, partial [Pavlovales sp. CCMP2436]
TRISLVGQLALSTRIKPELKAALSRLGELHGRVAMVRELRDKSAYPPTYLTLRCELAPFYKGAALAEGAMWAACREHLVGDLSDYLQCDELQLVLQGEEDTLTPEAMRPACLVRLFVVPSMNERVGEPRELIDALRSSIVSMGRDFTLPALAEALGVPEHAPAVAIHSQDAPEYTPLNALRLLREELVVAKRAADEARVTLSSVTEERDRRFRQNWGRLKERTRHTTPVLDGPLGPRKRAAEAALGREHALLHLEKDCPAREEVRRARLWLPVELKKAEAAAAEEITRAQSTVDRLAPTYAARRALKAQMRAATRQLLALRERLPAYVLESLK